MSYRIIFALTSAAVVFAQEQDWSKLGLIVGDQYRRVDIVNIQIDAIVEGGPLTVEVNLNSGNPRIYFNTKGRTVHLDAISNFFPLEIDMNSIVFEQDAYDNVWKLIFRAGPYLTKCKNRINGLSQSYYTIATDLREEYTISALEYSNSCELKDESLKAKMNWEKQ